MKKFIVMFMGILINVTPAWTMTGDSKTEVQVITPADGIGDGLGDDLFESLGRMAVSVSRKKGQAITPTGGVSNGHGDDQSLGRMAVSRKLGRGKSRKGSKSKHRQNQSSVSSVQLDEKNVKQVRNNAMVVMQDEKENCQFVSPYKLYLWMENYGLRSRQQDRAAMYQNTDMQNDAKEYLIFQLKKYVKDPKISIGHITRVLSSKDQHQAPKDKVVYCMFYLLHINLVYPQQVKYAVKELDQAIRQLAGDFTRINFNYQMVEVAVQCSILERNSRSIRKTNFPVIQILGTGAFDDYDNHDIYKFPSAVYEAITGYVPGKQPKVPVGAYDSESESRANGHSRNQSKSIWLFSEEELAQMNEELATR